MNSKSKKRPGRKKQTSLTSLRLNFEASDSDGPIDSGSHDSAAVDYSFSERLANRTTAEEIEIYTEIRELVKDRYT